MGIKTSLLCNEFWIIALKNLPTTWGLRLVYFFMRASGF